LAACDHAPVLTVNYVYYDEVTDEQLDGMIESMRAGDVPQAARGGIPGDLKEVSLTLAGVATVDRAPKGSADA
jgi:NADH-quinone oxidoreductase subunit E